MINLHNEDNRSHRQEKEEMKNMLTMKVYANEDNYLVNRDYDIQVLYMEIRHAIHD
jgi:hypothetical protein